MTDDARDRAAAPIISIERYVELMGQLAAHRLMLAGLVATQSILIGELANEDPLQRAEQLIKHALLGVVDADNAGDSDDRVLAMITQGAHLELVSLRESVRLMLARAAPSGA